METNIEIYPKKDKKTNCYCLWIILAIVGSVLTFFIGLLIAAISGILEGLGTPVIVALVIILMLLLITSIINVICCKYSNKKKYFCC